MLKHTHTCIKCGTNYTHTHPARTADHEQFAFQCVNSDCEWHPSRGQPKSRPDTWDEDGEKFEWPQARPAGDRGASAERKARTETYKQRSVRLAYERDDIKCGNADHFALVKEEGNQYKVVRPRDPLQILREMEPLVKARCPCERTACRTVWSWCAPGTLTTEWVMNGLYHKGIDAGPVPRRVMPVRYRMSKDQFNEVHRRFPDWYIVQTGSDGHDHPVSHTITQIANYEMFKSLKAGSRVIDMHGNPAANARQRSAHDLDIKTAVSLVTAKDYVRAATKWAGAAYTEVGYIRDMHRDHADLLRDRTVCTSSHTTYYYDMKEIASCLGAMAPKATWVALMHRFQGDGGELNNGELRWKRDGGDIIQTNVATGETYRHPDNRQWFERDAWASMDLSDPGALTGDTFEAPSAEHPEGRKIKGTWTVAAEAMQSLAWTKTEVTPGTYRIVATLVPNKAANMELHGDLTKPEWKPTTIRFAVASVTREFTIRDELLPLFNECRKAAVNKDRSEKRFQAHCATVSSKASSFWSVHKVAVSAQELAQIQMASFWIDFESQARDVGEVNVWSQFWVSEHKKLLNGMTLGKVENLIDLLFVAVDKGLEAKGGRSTLKAVHGVFNHIRTSR